MLLKTIQLLTTDLAASEQFYAQTLGLPILARTEKSVSFGVGKSTLTFIETKYSQPFYHLAFLIPANQLEEALEWISGKIPIIDFSTDSQIASFENWNAKAFYFHDPQGNILECIARFDLNNSSERPFEPASFLSINEIGIPVENVSQFCEGIHSKYHIPYFEKGPAFQDFTVMGEAEGLLIVTKAGRGWLPTQRPAEKHLISMGIELHGRNLNLRV